MKVTLAWIEKDGSAFRAAGEMGPCPRHSNILMEDKDGRCFLCNAEERVHHLEQLRRDGRRQLAFASLPKGDRD